MTAVENHKFATLDAMRGVAALAVVIFHFRLVVSPEWGERFVFASGYLAVDLFFLLSGFVIAYAYDARLKNGMPFTGFLKARMIRLLPMIVLGAVMGGARLFYEGADSPRLIATFILANAFIIPVVAAGGHLFATNGVEWSLFYEVVANCVYAALFRLLNFRTLSVIILASLVGLVLISMVHGRLHYGWTIQTAHVAVARVGFSFFLGIALCRCRTTWMPLVPRIPPVLILAIAAACLFVPATGFLRAVYDLGFVVLISPALVMSAAVVEPRGGRALATTLATLSYPIYAIHLPLRVWADDLRIEWGVSGLVTTTICVAALIPASLLVARYYDAPVRQWLARRLSRPPNAGAQLKVGAR